MDIFKVPMGWRQVEQRYFSFFFLIFQSGAHRQRCWDPLWKIMKYGKKWKKSWPTCLPTQFLAELSRYPKKGFRVPVPPLANIATFYSFRQYSMSEQKIKMSLDFLWVLSKFVIIFFQKMTLHYNCYSFHNWFYLDLYFLYFYFPRLQ